MLNNFTYHLEVNELNKTNTKQALKDKISKYNQRSFRITSGQKISIYLPYFTNPKHKAETDSILLNFQLLQAAITKYTLLFNINELPMYAEKMANLNFNIILKEIQNGQNDSTTNQS